MFIERYRKKKTEEEVKQYRGESKEGVPPAIVEILEDPGVSDVLAAIAQKNESVQQTIEKIEKIRRGEAQVTSLTKNEFQTLENTRTLINEALKKKEEVMELLKGDTIEIIANRSDAFRQIVGLLGPENTRRFLERYLATLYVEDKKKFQDLEQKIQDIKNAEEQLSKIEEQLREKAEKLGIQEEELAEALEAQNPEEAIRNLVRKSRGLVVKVKDFFTKGKWTEERVKELNKIQDINNQLETINNTLAEIGKRKGEAVFASKKGRELLTRAIMGFEETVKEPTMSFAEAFRGLDRLNEKDLNEELLKYYESIKGMYGKDFEALTENEIRDVKNRFADYKGKKMVERKSGEVTNIFANWAIKIIKALLS